MHFGPNLDIIATIDDGGIAWKRSNVVNFASWVNFDLEGEG